MNALYNEIEPYAVDWLRNLTNAGHIAAGTVEARSIAEVQPGDLAGYDQCHFFAGIGGWSYALRLAGWPDDQPVWTGSCPCQPFSSAGKRGGFADERHLWPEWFRLIRECRPPVIFGEQVASAAGLEWLDAVSADLEGAGYAVGAADLCAAGVGASHIRQRLYFVAYADGLEGRLHVSSRKSRTADIEAGGRGEAGQLGNTERGAAESDRLDLAGASRSSSSSKARKQRIRPDSRDASDSSFWSACDWLPCTDGKARPVEPGSFPLAHGVPNRVGKLRAYGNAIVPQVAAELIRAAASVML